MKIETQNRFSLAMKSVFDEIEKQDEKFGKDGKERVFNSLNGFGIAKI